MNLAGDSSGASDKRRKKGRVSIESLDSDIMCVIFSMVELFDLVRCSAVCKSWNSVITRCKLLRALYVRKQATGLTNLSLDVERPLNKVLEGLAMQRHRTSLVEGSAYVDQWIGHSSGIDQCRMKMGLILTGVGDKAIRLWSSETYKCLEEYPLSNLPPLVDYDFDESKIVGLFGTRLCIWRRHGNRTDFPSREGTFMKGVCMRYMDPEAVVGCDDGTVRIVDMYSRSCSQIIRMHSSPVTCLALGEDQLILAGSSLGRISVSGLSSDQRVAELKSDDRTGIKTLCYNPSSHLVFAGSYYGHVTCWDLRMGNVLWKTRGSRNVLYTMQHLRSDTSTLAVGGIDGVLRFLDQNSGEVLSCYVMDERKAKVTPVKSSFGSVVRKMVKRIPAGADLSNSLATSRPPITCLAVGMEKVVTTHNDKCVRVWKFSR